MVVFVSFVVSFLWLLKNYSLNFFLTIFLWCFIWVETQKFCTLGIICVQHNLYRWDSWLGSEWIVNPGLSTKWNPCSLATDAQTPCWLSHRAFDKSRSWNDTLNEMDIIWVLVDWEKKGKSLWHWLLWYFFFDGVSGNTRNSLHNCALAPGVQFNIKMSSYQYKKSHCRDKTVVRLCLYIESGPRTLFQYKDNLFRYGISIRNIGWSSDHLIFVMGTPTDMMVLSYWNGPQGALLLTWINLTLIPAWISNHMPSELWGEITYPFPNFNTLEWISNFILHLVMGAITYPCCD